MHRAGDLFIDCSGALLFFSLGGVLGVAWQDSDPIGVPCDRASAVPCRSMGALTPIYWRAARPAGWTWRILHKHRTGNGDVFSSQFISDTEAREAYFLAVLDGTPKRGATSAPFFPGRRERAWYGNCVAIGPAVALSGTPRVY